MIATADYTRKSKTIDFLYKNENYLIFCNESNLAPSFQVGRPYYKNTMAKILWFTGLSGSGKTTIATNLQEKLLSQSKRVLTLDGDVVRETLHKNLGFSPQDIHENNRLIANLAKEQSPNYDYIIVPIISPFQQDRQKARHLLHPNFIEIFINAPIEECIRRDVKGHYQKALRGEIKNFIGIAKENPYEPPSNPEIHIKTKEQTIEQSTQTILTYLLNHA